MSLALYPCVAPETEQDLSSSPALELHRARAPLDLIKWTRRPPEGAEPYSDVDPLEYPPERRVDTSQPDMTIANLRIRLGDSLDFGGSGVVFEALILDEEHRRRLPPTCCESLSLWMPWPHGQGILVLR